MQGLNKGAKSFACQWALHVSTLADPEYTTPLFRLRFPIGVRPDLSVLLGWADAVLLPQRGSGQTPALALGLRLVLCVGVSSCLSTGKRSRSGW